MLLFSCFSCRKFVTVETPINLIGSAKVFEKNETANAAQLNIYSEMVENDANGYQIGISTGMYADELTSYADFSSYLQVYSNQLIPTTSDLTNQIWAAAYRYIYQANAVINGCENSKMLNSEVKKQLIAEATFTRAFWYFNLVNLYGNVPLVIATDYQSNQTISQSNEQIVYSKIVSDLNSAIINLKADYVAGDGITKSDQRARPNRFSAKALLARVYLYQGDYTKAKELAAEVISKTDLYEITRLSDVFKTNNRESIWQVHKPLPASYVTPEGSGFVLTGVPLTNLFGSSTISPQLLSAFDSTDKRKTEWIGKFTDVLTNPNVDYYYPNKYKIKTGSTLTEASTVLRLGEQYLIRAEANANLGNITEAIADLDVIKERAGVQLLRDKDPSVSKDNLIKEIMVERRLELFTEWGHRFFDLKRSNAIDQVMSLVTPTKQGTWESKDRLWCIPQTDIFNNTNLKQNPGYN